MGIRKVTLKGVREARGIPGSEVAKAMEMRDTGVYRIESGMNVQIDTLARYAAGLGGRIEHHIVFDDPEGEVRYNLNLGSKARTKKVATRSGSPRSHRRVREAFTALVREHFPAATLVWELDTLHVRLPSNSSAQVVAGVFAAVDGARAAHPRFLEFLRFRINLEWIENWS